MSEDADIKPLLEKLIVMVDGIARDIASLRSELGEMRAVQVRHGARLALIDSYLDEQGHATDDLLRP